MVNDNTRALQSPLPDLSGNKAWVPSVVGYQQTPSQPGSQPTRHHLSLANSLGAVQWSIQCQKSKYCPVQCALISSPGFALANFASTRAVHASSSFSALPQ